MQQLSRNSWVVILLILIFCQNSSAQFQVQTLKAKRPGFYTAVTTYPRFRETTALTRFANSAILDWVKLDQEEYIVAATDEEAAEIRVTAFGRPCAATVLWMKTGAE